MVEHQARHVQSWVQRPYSTTKYSTARYEYSTAITYSKLQHNSVKHNTVLLHSTVRCIRVKYLLAFLVQGEQCPLQIHEGPFTQYIPAMHNTVTYNTLQYSA